MSFISLFTPINTAPSSFDNLHVSGAGVAPLSTVSVFKNGTLLGTAVADSTGHWTYTLGSATSPGDVLSYQSIPINQSITIP